MPRTKTTKKKDKIKEKEEKNNNHDQTEDWWNKKVGSLFLTLVPTPYLLAMPWNLCKWYTGLVKEGGLLVNLFKLETIVKNCFTEVNRKANKTFKSTKDRMIKLLSNLGVMIFADRKSLPMKYILLVIIWFDKWRTTNKRSHFSGGKTGLTLEQVPGTF